jgi:uncharacterized protein with ATP-grasp and redox domains
VRLDPECVPCLLARVRFESGLAAPERAIDAVLAAAREVADSCPNDVSAVVATRAHRAAYAALGTEDPYAELKRASNEVALRLLPRAREMLERSPLADRLRTAALLSIVGNILDSGIKGGLEDVRRLEHEFEHLVSQGLGRDDTDAMAPLLGPGTEVAYLADNCGEVVLDTLLMDELRARGCRVTLVVKGRPILTDATREDVRALGLAAHADAVMDTGQFAVGIDMATLPDETREAILGAGFVVSKGMANFESLSDSGIRPIAYLLRTKCHPVARTLGEAKDINVVKLYE